MEAMLKHAQDVLRMEAEAILELVPRVDENFVAAVKLILDCRGRTVITGMGKSGFDRPQNGCNLCQHRHTVLLSASCRGYSR